MSNQPDDDGGGVGQSDAGNDGRPTTERRTLQVKKEENPAEEALNGGAFAY